MQSRYATLMQALVLATALGVTPGVAQEAADIEGFIELARADAAQDLVALPGAELAGLLDAGSRAQREELVASLAADEVDAILASLALTGADPVLLADMVSAVITTDPEATDRIIETVLENSAPVNLPAIAQGIYEEIAQTHAEMSLPVFEGHVLAAVRFDRQIARQLVELGNSWDTANAARLARALATIADTADELLASAIETALALEGGQMLQLAAEFRDEIAVAATPDPAPVAPAPPAVPPAGIGGAGAADAGTAAATSGQDAIFASESGATTVLQPGPGTTRREQPRVVSPTN